MKSKADGLRRSWVAIKRPSAQISSTNSSPYGRLFIAVFSRSNFQLTWHHSDQFQLLFDWFRQQLNFSTSTVPVDLWLRLTDLARFFPFDLFIQFWLDTKMFTNELNTAFKALQVILDSDTLLEVKLIKCRFYSFCVFRHECLLGRWNQSWRSISPIDHVSYWVFNGVWGPIGALWNLCGSRDFWLTRNDTRKCDGQTSGTSLSDPDGSIRYTGAKGSISTPKVLDNGDETNWLISLI